jgi:hypothetical protein
MAGSIRNKRRNPEFWFTHILATALRCIMIGTADAQRAWFQTRKRETGIHKSLGRNRMQVFTKSNIKTIFI